MGQCIPAFLEIGRVVLGGGCIAGTWVLLLGGVHVPLGRLGLS